MIYEITKEIRAELSSKGVPYPVIYGPERAPLSMVDVRLVVERNRSGTDRLDGPRKHAANPQMFGVLWQACRCRVFARSTLPGAGVQDHEREAALIVDRFTVALHRVVRTRKNVYSVTRARFLSAKELELDGLEAWPGVVYEIEFEIDRGVVDTTWPVAPLHAIVTTASATGDASTAAGDLPSAQTR